jgi:hypothetical protein
MPNERQRQTSYGTLKLLTQDLPVSAASAGNGVTTVAYLHWGQPLYPATTLCFLRDGAGYPRGEDVQKFLTETKGNWAEADWKIPWRRFAPNAPDQNPTEDVGLQGKTYFRQQFAVNKTFAQVKRGFSTFFNALHFTSTKLSWYWPTEQMI